MSPARPAAVVCAAAAAASLVRLIRQVQASNSVFSPSPLPQLPPAPPRSRSSRQNLAKLSYLTYNNWTTHQLTQTQPIPVHLVLEYHHRGLISEALSPTSFESHFPLPPVRSRRYECECPHDVITAAKYRPPSPTFSRRSVRLLNLLPSSTAQTTQKRPLQRVDVVPSSPSTVDCFILPNTST